MLRKCSERIMFQPQSTSYSASNFRGELSVLNGVVCLSMPYHECSSHILLYLHANAEDLGNIYRVMKMLRDRLKVHVIAVEYPGYGVAEGKPGKEAIDQCVKKVFRYVRQQLSWPANRIIICGRSIGTGPATKLAEEEAVAALILISPYTRIKDVARNLFGRVGSIAPSHWNTRDSIQRVQCPTMFLHGTNDNLIPPEQSELLYNQSQLPSELKQLHIIDGFGHNEVNWPFMIHLMKNFLTKTIWSEELEKRPLLLKKKSFHGIPSADSQPAAGCDRCWHVSVNSRLLRRFFHSS